MMDPPDTMNPPGMVDPSGTLGAQVNDDPMEIDKVGEGHWVVEDEQEQMIQGGYGQLGLSPSVAVSEDGITPVAALDHFNLSTSHTSLTQPCAFSEEVTLLLPLSSSSLSSHFAVLQPDANIHTHHSLPQEDETHPSSSLGASPDSTHPQYEEFSLTSATSSALGTQSVATDPSTPDTITMASENELYDASTQLTVGEFNNFSLHPAGSQCVPGDLSDMGVWSSLVKRDQRQNEWFPGSSSLSTVTLRDHQMVGMAGDGDVQGILWEKWYGVDRIEIRRLRTPHGWSDLEKIDLGPGRIPGERRLWEHEKSPFQFSKTSCRTVPKIEHFQLRNLVESASQCDVYYAANRKIMHANLFTPIGSEVTQNTAMDLRSPDTDSTQTRGFHVTCLTTLSEDTLFAGGFSGQYAYLNLGSNRSTKPTIGRASAKDIINHVAAFPRHANPTAVLACNDINATIKLLDCTTNTITSAFSYKPDTLRHPLAEPIIVNCSATSPDARLRLLAGDFGGSLVTDARSGEILRELDSSREISFACAWADDGHTLATAAEDGRVHLWDARTWQSTASFEALSDYVRTLRFSPRGGGPQTLFAAEATDLVHVLPTANVDYPVQLLSFYGPVAGLAVSEDGSQLFVGNGDVLYGGVMVFDRTDWYEDPDVLGADELREMLGPRRRAGTVHWRDFEEPVRQEDGWAGTYDALKHGYPDGDLDLL